MIDKKDGRMNMRGVCIIAIIINNEKRNERKEIHVHDFGKIFFPGCSLFPLFDF